MRLALPDSPVHKASKVTREPPERPVAKDPKALLAPRVILEVSVQRELLVLEPQAQLEQLALKVPRV